MRTAVVALSALAMTSAYVARPSPAQARDYPWCAQYSERSVGASNCGFSTLEQCQLTISGVGGWCEPNPRYASGQGRLGRHLHRRYDRD